MKKRKKFIIEAEMEERWIPYVVGLLNTMQYLGNVGGSRMLEFFSDGDGDFHPKFKIKGLKDKKGANGYFKETGRYIFDPDTVSELPLYQCMFTQDCKIDGIVYLKGTKILAKHDDIKYSNPESPCYWVIVSKDNPVKYAKKKELLTMISRLR